MQFLKGHFYEFHRSRVISRPGAELRTRNDIEIGPEIPNEKQAIRQVKLGMDVYTPWKFDAYKLATRVYAKAPTEDPAEENAYYPHYHPGGEHRKRFEERDGRPRAADGAPGHVFFGDRGLGRKE